MSANKLTTAVRACLRSCNNQIHLGADLIREATTWNFSGRKNKPRRKPGLSVKSMRSSQALGLPSRESTRMYFQPPCCSRPTI
jgi:hypothetical protein